MAVARRGAGVPPKSQAAQRAGKGSARRANALRLGCTTAVGCASHQRDASRTASSGPKQPALRHQLIWPQIEATPEEIAPLPRASQGSSLPRQDGGKQ